MKRVAAVHKSPEGHWVGDGFPVRSLFSYHSLGAELSPFLLLDYAGPAEFAPAERPRGVGEHPHRGFETVTIVYQGEVEHRDSAGNGGSIGPGDVQWMTAAAGLMHEEFHSQAFTGARRHDGDGAAVGQPAGQGQDVAARAISRSSRREIPVVESAGGGGPRPRDRRRVRGVPRAGDDVHADQRLGRPLECGRRADARAARRPYDG